LRIERVGKFRDDDVASRMPRPVHPHGCLGDLIRDGGEVFTGLNNWVRYERNYDQRSAVMVPVRMSDEPPTTKP